MNGSRRSPVLRLRTTACLGLTLLGIFVGFFMLVGLNHHQILMSLPPVALKNGWKQIKNFTSRININDSKVEEDFNQAGVAADDPRVIEVLRKVYLDLPSSLPYNLVHNKSHNPSLGQAQLIDKILLQKRGGFFIEGGGFDGESYSNSLFFERERGWSGLLIEADLDNYSNLKKKQRKSYSSHTCLARTSYPKKEVFAKAYFAGRVLRDEDLSQALNTKFGELEHVQCFPLYSYLVALNRTEVDYLSLDVEGAEYDVLSHMPWDRAHISALSVEYHANKETYQPIIDLMEAVGYKMFTKITHYTNFADDFIFVKNRVLKEWEKSTESPSVSKIPER